MNRYMEISWRELVSTSGKAFLWHCLERFTERHPSNFTNDNNIIILYTRDFDDLLKKANEVKE